MKKKTITIIISALVAVLLVGAIAWSLVSGSLSLAWNGFGGQFSTTKVVCDEKVVEAYNKATEYTYPMQADAMPTMDIEALNKTVADVKTRAGHENDPTCQVMIFWAAIEAKEVDVAHQALDALKELHEKRNFPNNNLRTAVPLFEYDTALEFIATSSDETTE